MAEDNDVQHNEVSKLKHADDLCKVDDIVLKISIHEETEAYRLTHDPLEDEDFIPQAYLFGSGRNPPKEELDKLGEDERKKYATVRALSMYKTEAAAEKQARRIVKKLKEDNRDEDAELFKEEHAYITKFLITEKSGMVTKPHRTTKHFNFFPYENVDERELKDKGYEPKRIDYGTDGK